jgi:hypothetical protein
MTGCTAAVSIGDEGRLAPLLNLPAVWSSAVLAIASMGVGVVLALTALVRFCPLYRIIGISTGKI